MLALRGYFLYAGGVGIYSTISLLAADMVWSPGVLVPAMFVLCLSASYLFTGVMLHRLLPRYRRVVYLVLGLSFANTLYGLYLVATLTGANLFTASAVRPLIAQVSFAILFYGTLLLCVRSLARRMEQRLHERKRAFRRRMGEDAHYGVY